ncbi:MAG: hypothetical protein CBC82_07595 [Cellvibrionales bacterium TMED122]|nr:MAG: hypothetical protein CBC82_07595 [Cellvibrionales bacterium TMED122]|tara:strand:- start:1590 stop:2567 length:978 start_codon:yes stop_codon:yes gene_type:complete
MNKKKRVLTFAEAINEAMIQSMQLDPNVFIFGQGVDKTAQVFKTTKNILNKFGKKRIFDTPNVEQAETSLAAGAANAGLRPILIHHRVDFMAYTFDQLINWISLWSFKSAGKSSMPLVIRAIIGKGWGQGPQHAKTLHSTMASIPGLKVVMPSSPSEAKGLLISSIFSNDPVVFLEYRALYNTKEYVPKEVYQIDFSEPRIRSKGKKLTLVSMGSGILNCIQALEKGSIKNDIDLIDIRELSSFDIKVIFNSVKKTKKLMVVEDGWNKFSVGSEIISRVSEAGIKMSKPPVKVTWPHSHVPMSSPLESSFYPSKDIIYKKIKNLF